MESARRARKTEAARAKKRRCYKSGMIESSVAIAVMNDDDLVTTTREIASKSNGVEAELLLYSARSTRGSSTGNARPPR